MEPLKPIEPTLYGIAQALARLEQSHTDFRKELVGNGQPGKIQKIEEKLDEHDDKFETLNKKHYLITGVIVAASHGLRAALVKMGII
jgi:hypothetical protein